MAAFTNFKKWENTPFGPHILPIIPVGAKLKEGSKIDPAQLGKVPGKWLPEEKVWTGFFGWQNYRTTRGDLARWDRWQVTDTNTVIGSALILGRNFIAFDIDCDNDAIADEVEARITLEIGYCPAVRLSGNSPRRVLFYARDQHTAPVYKRTLTFLTTSDGTKHAVELLGAGQKIMIEGPHASGAKYSWENGDLNAHTAWFEANKIGVTAADRVMTELDKWVVETPGLEKVKLSLPSGGDVDAVSVTDIMSPNRSLDLDVLERCVKAIDLNDAQLVDYTTWLNLLRAICAACGGDMAFFGEVVLPWLHTNTENVENDGDARMELKWRTFDTSALGAEFVYRWAASFGCNDGIALMEQDHAARAEELFNGTPDVTPDAAVDQDQLAAGAGANGAVGGGPLPFNDTHDALAADFEAANQARWRFDTREKKWYVHEEIRWTMDDRIVADIRALTVARSRLILATVNGPQGAARSRALENNGTIRQVKNLMEGSKTLTVNHEAWDRDLHLLNTPGGVVDLRAGRRLPHDPSLLMRGVTLVTPDMFAIGGDWSSACPKWFAFLQRIAYGRSHVIPLLQRWFGYCLTGELTHQHLLFIQGLPGTGKSQLVTVLMLLLGSYAVSLRQSWILKGPDKRFDMVHVMGKRMGFIDETQKGASWDETRASTVATAKRLEAEFKGGAEINFDNTIKLIIAGNHYPHFVSAEAGGLMRRMLLLELINPPFCGTDEDIANYAQMLVAQEGPAILAWCIEGAMRDYADENHLIFNDLRRPLLEASQEYARESNPIRDWVEAEMRVDPELDIDLLAAWERYNAFVRRAGGVTRETRRGFKTALQAAYPSVVFGLRASFKDRGKSFIKGIGFNQADFGETAA